MATTKKSLTARPLADQPLANQQLVNVHQAKTQLSQLLQQVEQGQEVVIARSGVPIARLVAWQAPVQAVTAPGAMHGQIKLPIRNSHRLAVGELESDGVHRDPFDRLLVCQSWTELPGAARSARITINTPPLAGP